MKIHKENSEKNFSIISVEILVSLSENLLSLETASGEIGNGEIGNWEIANGEFTATIGL